MEFLIKYSMSGSLIVEAETAEQSVAKMKANMIPDIFGGLDPETISINSADPLDSDFGKYIRRAV